jgi:uncharacterized protein (TIGR02453 family)
MIGNSDFSGFPKQLPEFLSELKLNNEKPWFEANRERFDRLCVEPALAFIRAMAEQVEKFDPPHRAEAKVNGSLRRIYRDTRFSKDKTPYHTYLHLIFWAGSHPMKSPGLHVVLSPGGFGIGAGHWGFDAGQLARYREAIGKPEKAAALDKAIAAAKKTGCHLEQPALKRIPKEFDPAKYTGSAESHIRQKGLVVRNRNEDYDEAMFDGRCADYVAKRMGQLLALQKWLMEHVYK